MRAALLVSLGAVICAVSAAFGVPAVYWDGEAITGLTGLVVGLSYATIPPVLVAVFRMGKDVMAGQ